MNKECEEYKSYLYSRNMDTVLTANKALGLAIGDVFKNKVAIYKFVDSLASTMLINSSVVKNEAIKYRDYVDNMNNTIRFVYGPEHIFKYSEYYTDDDIKHIKDNSSIYYSAVELVRSLTGE